MLEGDIKNFELLMLKALSAVCTFLFVDIVWPFDETIWGAKMSKFFTLYFSSSPMCSGLHILRIYLRSGIHI